MAIKFDSPFVKKYWPYALGGVIGIVIIYKFYGSGSGSSSSSNFNGTGMSAADYATVLTAQGNAGSAMTIAQGQANLSTSQGQALISQGQASIVEAQGNASADYINALNAPTIQAIQSAQAVSDAAIQAAAQTQIANNIAAGQVSSDFYNMVGTIGLNAAQAIQGVGSANANSNAMTTGLFTETVGSVIKSLKF